MNDFLFLILIENLMPIDATWSAEQPWFSVVPAHWRNFVLVPIADRCGMDLRSTAFLLTRAVAGALFVSIALTLAFHARHSDESVIWFRAVFLSLAWLWLLAPTQNPWYWIWAMPFVAFARCRAWLLVSGLALAYYLRFWLVYHWPDEAVPGFRYAGAPFFDFVVTWLEFAPWFVLLVVEAVAIRCAGDQQAPHPGTKG